MEGNAYNTPPHGGVFVLHCAMQKVEVKPISVNTAWKGRRFKSNAYKAFEYHCLMALKPVKIPDGQLCVYFVFAFSNDAQDIDNSVKMCMDILQKKHGFNDKRVSRLVVDKVIVPKGEEHWCYSITENK
jgi:Holliday junction resolvase RusA-like endonuclease